MIRTVIYLIVLSAVNLGLGYLIGARQGLLIAFIFTFIVALISALYSEDIILWTYMAVPLEGADPYKLNKKVAEFAKKTGVEKPQVYILPGDTPNAMALGRGPGKSSIALTEGILKKLNEQELDTVLAFLVSRIQNGQTGLQMFSACLSSFVLYVVQFFKWIFSFGADDSKRRRPRISGKILEGMSAPFAGTLVKLTAGKGQFFIADGGAVELTQNAQAFATALWKLSHYSTALPLPATPATGNLFIVNPNETYGYNWFYRIHPQVNERIKKLIGRAL